MFTFVTAWYLTHIPVECFVDGLQWFGFPLHCHPSYGVLPSAPVGFCYSPTEYPSLVSGRSELLNAPNADAAVAEVAADIEPPRGEAPNGHRPLGFIHLFLASSVGIWII